MSMEITTPPTSADAEVDNKRAKSTLFVRNLPFDATNEEFEDFFSEVGPIRSCFVVQDKEKSGNEESDKSKPMNKGFGFINFAQAEDAARAITELSKKKFRGERRLRIEFAIKKADTVGKEEVASRKRKSHEGNNNEGTRVSKKPMLSSKKGSEKDKKHSARLIIRNMSFKCHEKQLRKTVSAFGTVKELLIPRKYEPNGPYRGFGIVEFGSVDEAQKCIDELNGMDLLGRVVAVDWCLPKDKYVTAEAKETAEEQTNEETDQEVSDESMDGDDGDETDEEDETEITESINIEGIESNNLSDGDMETESESEEALGEQPEGDNDDSETVSSQTFPKKSAYDTDSDDEDEESKVQRNKNLPAPDEGTTVFIRNICFDTSEHELYTHFSQFGDLVYAKITRDPQTRRSRGTAFVCFSNREDVNNLLKEYKAVEQFVASTPVASTSSNTESATQRPHLITPDLPAKYATKFTLASRLLNITLAVDKKAASKLASKSARSNDKRNLYLLREGVIFPDSEVASKMDKNEVMRRFESYKERKDMLKKNGNLFVSEVRLSVRNLGRLVDEKTLKKVCKESVEKFRDEVKAGKRKENKIDGLNEKVFITQSKIVRSKDRIDPSTNLPRSKGYGFVQFTRHAHALACLRYLNNRPGAFTNAGSGSKGMRPLVEFAVENNAVVKLREDRIRKGKERFNSNQAQDRQRNEGHGNYGKPEMKGKNRPDSRNDKNRKVFSKPQANGKSTSTKTQQPSMKANGTKTEATDVSAGTKRKRSNGMYWRQVKKQRQMRKDQKKGKSEAGKSAE
ncbi:hypothetical protein BKA69DRAFT_504154 [Paraphysoderma sedebokerense]|nr:hypothetical protein BKA69DRAFT_941078 [Paraphysoderma sedebokerense]KAI9140667.1 hypothetical protein BKA69DRAFT_504154 [Paraphysoderma sedebokerense]